MNFDFESLQRLCANWLVTDIPQSPSDNNLLERVRQILLAVAQGGRRAVVADLAPLVRQLIIRQKLVHGADERLSVPTAMGWPSKHDWQHAGFEVLEHRTGLTIQPKDAKLEWLNTQADIFQDVFLQIASPERSPIQADPFYKRLMKWAAYNAEGQREAVRTLLHAPLEHLIIANLPTGSGKTVLAQLPALLNPVGRFVLVIVPTVALALDQARRMSALLAACKRDIQPNLLAYHGGLNELQRADIRSRIDDGSLPILFTSPESAIQSLRFTLMKCAKERRISHVIVDEAHLIAGWGNSFRPAYQVLPALLKDLRRQSLQSSIQLVLASATLTAETLDQLTSLLDTGFPATVISAIHLRAEPRYAIRYCPSDEIRAQRVIDAIRVAPRPFILYVTTPKEAANWERMLREVGHQRIGSYHGETATGDRERLLSDWNNNRLDGMIATSAFGLGVDKSDVRTIIHATLPESLDRFYQEVGRGGRDGRAAASLLLWTSPDVRQAERLATVKQLGNQRAFIRWTALLASAKPDSEDSTLHWVDPTCAPADLPIRSKRGTQWNTRLLNMMARAGIIELVALRGDQREFTDGLTQSFADGSAVAVRILDTAHNDPRHFSEALETARASIRNASNRNLESMMAVANGSTEISVALAETYRASTNGFLIQVTTCCGGCENHWATRKDSVKFTMPKPIRLSHFARRDELPRAFSGYPLAGQRTLLVALPDQREVAEYETKIIKSVPIGLSLLKPHTLLLDSGLSSSVRTKIETVIDCLLDQHAGDSSGVSTLFIDDFDARKSPPEPGIHEIRLVVYSGDAGVDLPYAIFTPQVGFQILFFPSAIRHPQNHERRLVDTTPHITMEHFIRRATR